MLPSPRRENRPSMAKRTSRIRVAGPFPFPVSKKPDTRFQCTISVLTKNGWQMRRRVFGIDAATAHERAGAFVGSLPTS